MLLIRLLYPVFIKPSNLNIANLKLIDLTFDSVYKHSHTNTYFKTSSLFAFNPNTVSLNDLLKLGFKEKTAQTFIKFRNSGFVFRKKEDLKKIYGVNEKLYARLEKFIVISTTGTLKNNVIAENKRFNKKQTNLLEINSADSLALIDLRGVGPAFAKRILKYKRMLGGFVHIKQLKEVYGMTNELHELLIEQCTVNPKAISKIKINTAEFKTLNKHPYFNYELTKHICNYRKNNKITAANLLEIIQDENLTESIRPYLDYE